jgi:hypothetical protein
VLGQPRRGERDEQRDDDSGPELAHAGDDSIGVGHPYKITPPTRRERIAPTGVSRRFGKKYGPGTVKSA